MQPGDVPPEARLYAGQETVQLLLLLLAALSVPWMLLAKPLILRRRHQATIGYKHLRAREYSSDSDSSRSLLRSGRDDDDSLSIASSNNGKLFAEDFDFTEVMVHQVCPPSSTLLMALGLSLLTLSAIVARCCPHGCLPSASALSLRSSIPSSMSSAASLIQRRICASGRSH
eukprot:scaffold21168_cov35-Tisochrysis_lutea.AAC.2